MKQGVRTEHPEYSSMLPQWEMCCDLEKGQRAVHAAGVRYLPKLVDETETEYAARKARSDFFNAFFRTINGLVGMAFRKDPETDLPAVLEGYVDNIDLAGMTLVGKAKDVCEDLLQYGRVGIMVDHPPMPDNVSPMSAAIAENLGMRPAIQTYDARAIINWRYRTVGNVKVLERVVLKEMEWIDVDEWEQKAEDRYRVLDLDDAGFYRQRVYRINEGKDELLSVTYPLVRGQALTAIPFVLIDPNGMGGKVEEPPLIDLAYKNIAHYQVNADYRHGGHYTALPTLFLSGVSQEGEIRIGGNAAYTAQDPNARGEYIEYKGSGLSTLESQLERLEQQMAVLGAQMLVQNARREVTATEASINKSGENSVMASLVIAVSDAFTWALQVMADWVGVSGDVKFEINREFNPMGLTAQEFVAYMGAVQQGLMSEREFFELNQRSDIISGEKTFDDHQAEVQDTMSLPAPDIAA